jgi:hypothetical protein
MQHVVEVVVGRVQFLDIAGRIELLHELAIRQDDVIGAGRRLGDQAQHVVAACIILRLELHVVGRFELANDVGLAMAIPGQHVDLDRVSPCTADERHRQRSRAAIPQHVAARRRQNRIPDIAGHFHLSCLILVPRLPV